MYEKHWTIILSEESPWETDDPAVPDLTARSLRQQATPWCAIVLLAALPYYADACERAAYPFPERCAPLADVPDAIKSLLSTATASMIISDPQLGYMATGPNSGTHLEIGSAVFRLG